MEGRVLDAWLDQASVQRDLQSGTPPATDRLVRQLAQAARLPWLLATAEDARVDGVTGAPRAGLFEVLGRRYFDEVLNDAVRHPHSQRRFTEVSNLMRHPIALLDPVVVARVASGVVRRRLGRRQLAVEDGTAAALRR